MPLKQHGSLCRRIRSLQWTFISFSHTEGITSDDLRGTLRLHSPRFPVNNNILVLEHFRKSKLNRTQLNRLRFQVKTHAKDDHGKTRGDMNVTARTDASKFKSGGAFALIVSKSCGHSKVGDKYHNLGWVENDHVCLVNADEFHRWPSDCWNDSFSAIAVDCILKKITFLSDNLNSRCVARAPKCCGHCR